MNGSTTNGASSWTLTFSYAPVCACGCGALASATFSDGTQWSAECVKREQRRRAISSAEGWLTAALAAAPDVSRLYRSLAAAFHPDVGGDPALMVALNAVRERFPS